MICPVCGKNRSECICQTVETIWQNYTQGNIPKYITQNSTGANTLFVHNYILGRDVEIDSKEKLFTYVYNNQIDLNSFVVTHSTHKGYLSYAKKHLIERVLGVDYPTLVDMEIVILLAGTAVNKQIDKDVNVKASNHTSIIDKLKEVNSKASNKYQNRLLDDYKELNKYYNSTKHEKESYNEKYERKLCSSEGRLITIHFFETIRRLFLWYYDNFSSTGIPGWDQLEEIDYSTALYDYKKYSLKKLP